MAKRYLEDGDVIEIDHAEFTVSHAGTCYTFKGTTDASHLKYYHKDTDTWLDVEYDTDDNYRLYVEIDE